MIRLWCFILVTFLGYSTLQSDDFFPQKPLRLIVGFGVGGSSDRLARAMKPFLHEMFKTEIEIINMEGEGSQVAASYFLSQSDDGYTLFCSTFTPYLAHTILVNHADYSLDDFAFINLQWFDHDIVAVHVDSSFKSLPEILKILKEKKKKLKIAVMEDSSGHLLLKLLLNAYNIPENTVEIHLFNNGKMARDAIKDKHVDVIIISSQGSELIREQIRTLAVSSAERHPQWDVPTVNEAVEPLGFQIPLFTGSMRGFAVAKSLKEKYPERYHILVEGFLKVLAKKEVQKRLREERIGGTWIGPKKSTRLINETFKVYEQNAYLLKP
jgi:tripartite-type tricarboxylate transporter receptor subunit TctC